MHSGTRRAQGEIKGILDLTEVYKTCDELAGAQ